MIKPFVAASKIIRSATPTEIQEDIVAVEEPLEMRVEYGPAEDRQTLQLSVTMRTPGYDVALTTGFLFTEGIIQKPADVVNIRYCENIRVTDEQGNIIKAILNPDLSFDPAILSRNFYTSSSCGVCGKTSLESVMVSSQPVKSNLHVKASDIYRSPSILLETQQVFKYTGGLHAAGAFDMNGNIMEVAEDVGRHNAFDKLIGSFWERLEVLQSGFVVLSGRASFELIQKAARAGVPVVAAVGAPSSLAVKLATEMGITLLGFVRDNSFNCYSHADRIDFI